MEAKITTDKDLKAGQQYIEIAGQKIPFPEGTTTITIIIITFIITITIIIITTTIDITITLLY